MPNVTEKKHPFTAVVDKKLFLAANRARKKIGLTWPQVLVLGFNQVIADAIALGKYKKKPVKDDLGF